MLLSRLTLIFIVLIASGFGVLLKHLLDDLERQTLQATEESMIDSAHILASMIELQSTSERLINLDRFHDMISHAHNHEFKAKIYQFGKSQIGLNAYITDLNGTVLLDTGRPERIGEDFSSFNDVHRTLKGNYGARSTRVDENDPHSSEMHVAAPLKINGDIIGVLTLYKPQSDVIPFIESRRRWITASCGMIALGILCFSIAVFIWLFQPIGKLTRYAESISRGERPKLPQVGHGSEANTLAHALGNMRETLEGRRYMENYVQILTHELKSPLAAIKGAAELLEEDMPSHQRQRFLSNIQHETERSQKIIEGLLKLSRLEGKHHIEHVETLHLANLIKDVCQTFSQRGETKNLSILLEIPPDVSFRGDPMMLQTAIGNLLENAIEFSPIQGEILIKAAKDAETHTVIITVQDQGPGIPEFALERVFEHFYSRSEDGSQKSSGLGLAFVREVATLHNGSVRAENLQPHGTKFTLYIQPIEQQG